MRGVWGVYIGRREGHKNIATEGDIVVSNLGLVSTAVSTCTTKFVNEGDVTVAGTFNDFLTITFFVFVNVKEFVESFSKGWMVNTSATESNVL